MKNLNEANALNEIKEMQLVIFRLGKEEYGVSIKHVKEINKTCKPTKMPYTEGYIEGVIQLREEIIPLVDLRKCFGKEINNNEDSRIVVVELQNEKMGVIVDEVVEVKKITTDNIEFVDESSIIANPFVKLIGKSENRLLLIMDINCIFDKEYYRIVMER